MALRFMDGFDHYTSLTHALYKWTAAVNANPTFNASAGRFGGGAMDGQGDTRGICKTLDNQQTWIVGFALKNSATPAGDLDVCYLKDGGRFGTTQVTLRINSGGKLQATRNGTVLGTGTATISPNVFYYLEIKAVIDNTTGAVTIRLNGVNDLVLTSQDTQASANAYADTIQFFGQGSGVGVNPTLDDVYVLDGTGGSPYDDFLGDCRVQGIFPSGNGNSSQFTGSDGNSTDNYLLVDDAAPNDDTDYVESSNVGDKDTYAFGNITPTSGTVYGIQILPYAEKTDAGTRKIVTVARLSGTEVDSSDLSLSSSYQYLSDIRTTKPGGGSWSISDINSAEFGQKVSA